MKQFQGETIDIKEGRRTKCPRCGKLLFKGELAKYTKVELWCSRCKKEIRIRVI